MTVDGLTFNLMPAHRTLLAKGWGTDARGEYLAEYQHPTGGEWRPVDGHPVLDTREGTLAFLQAKMPSYRFRVSPPSEPLVVVSV